MTNIKILNYNDESFDTGCAIEDVDYIEVTVISGDELININLKNGDTRFFDSADLADNPRVYDFYDGSYTVTSKNLERWNGRKSSYDFN